MKYFGRVYRLEVGNDSDVIVFNGFPDKVSYPAQIEFSVDQTPNSERSYAEITVYGVMKERRRAIYEEFDSVRLVAGWKDGFSNVFEGAIENVSLGRDSVDSTITLYCQSAVKEWPTAYINKSFGKGSSYLSIVREIASTFAIPVEFVGDFSSLPKAINGYAVSQDSKSALRSLSNSFDFEWLIENNKMIIAKNGYYRDSTEVFKYSAVTGLIGSPEITQKGVDINALLNPFIRPWDRFEVEAVTGNLTFNGIYYFKFPGTNGKGEHSVVSLKHEGNFYGSKWQTRIEGVRPSAI